MWGEEGTHTGESLAWEGAKGTESKDQASVFPQEGTHHTSGFYKSPEAVVCEYLGGPEGSGGGRSAGPRAELGGHAGAGEARLQHRQGKVGASRLDSASLTQDRLLNLKFQRQLKFQNIKHSEDTFSNQDFKFLCFFTNS